MSFKHFTVRHQSPKFARLYRLNYRLHGIEIFSDLWSSLIVFRNIWRIKLLENKITFTKVVSLELKYLAPKPEVSEMDVNFRLQNGLTLLSRLWTSRSNSKKAHKMILTWCSRRFSKSVVIFLKTLFLGLRKKSVFQEISLFSVFFFFFFFFFFLILRTTLFTSALKPG